MWSLDTQLATSLALWVVMPCGDYLTAPLARTAAASPDHPFVRVAQPAPFYLSIE